MHRSLPQTIKASQRQSINQKQVESLKSRRPIRLTKQNAHLWLLMRKYSKRNNRKRMGL